MPSSGPGPEAWYASSGDEGPGIQPWMTRSETPWEYYTMLRSWVVADCVGRVPSLKAQLSKGWRGGYDRPVNRYLCAGRHPHGSQWKITRF